METGRFNNEDMTPICKFGPGGEYVSFLPKEYAEIASPNNPLAKALEKIAKIMGTPIKSVSPVSLKPVKIYSMEEQGESEPNTKSIACIAASVGNSQADSKLSKQQSLFSVDAGACRAGGNKPAYRIRAYRRPARKRTAGKIGRQGTLFDDNLVRAKTA